MTTNHFSWPTKEDYETAINNITLAMEQLKPDGQNCNICGDTDHQAFECDENPLRLARKWQSSVNVWRCWHCGFVATTEEQAVDHFGKADDEIAKCLNVETVQPIAFMTADKRMLVFSDRIVGDGHGMIPLYSARRGST